MTFQGMNDTFNFIYDTNADADNDLIKKDAEADNDLIKKEGLGSLCLHHL